MLQFSNALVFLILLFSVLEYYLQSFTISLAIGIQPWALLTSTLVETNLISLVVNTTAAYFITRYFESRWGWEILTHFMVNSLCTNIIMLFIVALFGYEESNGIGSFVLGLLIALKRQIPEHSLRIVKYTVRMKYLPSIVFLVHLSLYIFGIIGATFYSHIIGMIVSWIYMRYYKIQDGVRGDRSETFSFVSFFPDQWSPELKKVSTAVYTTMVRFSLLPPLPTRKVDVEIPTTELFENSQVDADRRKARALQALEERLNSNNPK